jgi:hypothetical protein
MGGVLYLSSHAEHTTVEYAGLPHMVLVCMHSPQWTMQGYPTVVLVAMHSPQWNMQGCPTVILIYMHSPQVEYEGVPHSDTYLCTICNTHSGIMQGPQYGTRLYDARPQWEKTDQRDAMGAREYRSG